jgi:hypothetical protein
MHVHRAPRHPDLATLGFHKFLGRCPRYEPFKPSMANDFYAKGRSAPCIPSIAEPLYFPSPTSQPKRNRDAANGNFLVSIPDWHFAMIKVNCFAIVDM